MDHQLPITIPAPEPLMQHHDKVLLLGSCFTEHISQRMEQGGMVILANPHGILFNPKSVAQSLRQYLKPQTYTSEHLFQQQEIWNNWDFHSRFSHTNPTQALQQMNQSVADAAAFLPQTDWLFITLGSAYQYFTSESAVGLAAGKAVSNCHRAPAAWFDKQLLSVKEIVADLQLALAEIRECFPEIRVVFTISPVRHARDGLVANNRSKARLIEAVHQLCESLPRCYYFPAYELVMDVLRDHRYYDIDLVHPNYAATQYVWEQFVLHWMNSDAKTILPQFQDLFQARKHRPRFSDTQAHQRFVESFYLKAKQLQAQYPYAQLKDTIAYFASHKPAV